MSGEGHMEAMMTRGEGVGTRIKEWGGEDDLGKKRFYAGFYDRKKDDKKISQRLQSL